MHCQLTPRHLLINGRLFCLQTYPPLRILPRQDLRLGAKRNREMPVPSLIPSTAAAISPIWISLLGGGTIVGLLAAVQKYAEWVIARKEGRVEMTRRDSASVEIAHIEQEGEENRRTERMLGLMLDERKDQVAGLKVEVTDLKAGLNAQRSEFDAKIVRLEEGQRAEAEARQMVKVLADAAHLRADEAVKDLAAAKTERDELAHKLQEVEARADRAEMHSQEIETAKNLEVLMLSEKLEAANKKITSLEDYIKEQKLTLRIEQGDQTITASVDPLPTLPA